MNPPDREGRDHRKGCLALGESEDDFSVRMVNFGPCACESQPAPQGGGGKQSRQDCDNCKRNVPTEITAVETEDGAYVGTWCVTCHDQKVLASRDSQLAEKDARIASLEAAHRQRRSESEDALRALTPGGSEFQTAKECSDYVRRQYDELHAKRIENVETRREIAAQSAEIERLKARVRCYASELPDPSMDVEDTALSRAEQERDALRAEVETRRVAFLGMLADYEAEHQATENLRMRRADYIHSQASCNRCLTIARAKALQP